MKTAQTKIAHIYNPDNQTPEELINSFVIRLKEFRQIFDDIKSSKMENPEQHYIIQGARGTGKTTLLLRIYHEIKRGPGLQAWLIPVMFPEEHYNMGSLCDLWEGAAEKLAQTDGFAGLGARFEEARGHERYDEECFGILEAALRANGKKLVLFIDNIGDVLDRIDETEQHRFREILLTSPDFRVVGASAGMLEHTYDYGKPFFEFFKMVQLRGLNRTETTELLLKLAENYKNEAVKEIVERQPERIETLRRLTGGIPRTVILLFEILADDASGDSFRDLEVVLDRVTPLYKHRMDDLPVQQQRIVDAMAMHWDGISTGEIAKKVRLDSKAVSAQLNQLLRSGLVTRIKTTTKNHLYMITERFFNIWYLMRFGRRGGVENQRVKWLVKFLSEWCSKDELVERANRHISALSNDGFYAGHAYYFTEALALAGLPMKEQHELITATREFLKSKDEALAKELMQSDIEILNKSVDLLEAKDVQGFIGLLENNARLNELPIVLSGLGIAYSNLGDLEKAETLYLKSIEKGNDKASYALAVLYYDQGRFDKAETYYLRAIEAGVNEALNNLGALYHKQGRLDEAEFYYLKAIEKGTDKTFLNLGVLYSVQGRFDEAETFYLKAIEKGDDKAFNRLGILYSKQGRFAEAEPYYLKAIEKGSPKAYSLLSYAYWAQKKEKEKALEYALMEYAAVASYMSRIPLILAFIWNNRLEEAFELLKEHLRDKEALEDSQTPIIIQFLIAKGQYHYVKGLFDDEALGLKDRMRPVYYALMHFMEDEYPNEYKRMGEELRETTEEVIKNIEELAKL